jgi:hypothetical protein
MPNQQRRIPWPRECGNNAGYLALIVDHDVKIQPLLAPGQLPFTVRFDDLAVSDNDAVKVPFLEGLQGSLESRLVLDRHSKRPRHARVVFGANGAQDQKTGPGWSAGPKLKSKSATIKVREDL